MNWLDDIPRPKFRQFFASDYFHFLYFLFLQFLNQMSAFVFRCRRKNRWPNNGWVVPSSLSRFLIFFWRKRIGKLFIKPNFQRSLFCQTCYVSFLGKSRFFVGELMAEDKLLSGTSITFIFDVKFWLKMLSGKIRFIQNNNKNIILNTKTVDLINIPKPQPTHF